MGGSIEGIRLRLVTSSSPSRASALTREGGSEGIAATACPDFTSSPAGSSTVSKWKREMR